MEALLVGGPGDGKKVEIIGTCYEMCVPAKYLRFVRAAYRWEAIGNSVVGRFAGYYSPYSGKKVDCLGRKTGRKKA